MERAHTDGLPRLGGLQLTSLVALRMLVGWHFLYEGLAKVTNPGWTSAAYLQEAQGWFAGFFRGLAVNPGALTLVDQLNQWGLMLIGLALLLGIFTRVAIVAGLLLLALYYLAAPPFPGLEYAIPTEGSYLIVNKILIEMGVLLVLFGFPTSHQVGLDRLLATGRGDLQLTTNLATEETS
ncbi:MAG: DoxX family membrane protein [Gemmatimonadota bacterium]|jgi:thiosulfate dehydrogenase [quinone] large subunit